MFIQFLSTIKVKLADKMMQNTYLCIFYMSSTKNYQFPPFYLISNSWLIPRWGKMTTILVW